MALGELEEGLGELGVAHHPARVMQSARGRRPAASRRLPPWYRFAMHRLLLVDGHSNLYRAFFAIRAGLAAPDGTPTNAAYGFLRMQHKMLRELEPSHVAVAFDTGGETFRTRLDERYKAHRPPMPDDLRVQVPITQEAVALLGLAVLAQPDVEADDVIGTLAVLAARSGFEVVIASSDKDLMQLVADPLVKMWHTRLERLLDERGVEEVFGVPPARVGEVLALMGDASDNIPGCKGIGEKTAKELIAAWGSVDAVYAHLDEVTPPRARKALAEHRGEVDLSRELVRIRTDLALGSDLAALERRPADVPRLAELYRRLGFTSLLAETEAPPAAPAAAPVAARAAGLDELAALLAQPGAALALAGGRLAVATATETAVVEAEERELAAAAAPGLAQAWCHDAKALLAALRDAGVAEPPVPRDAMLAAYLLAPGESTDLPGICRRLGVEPPALAGPEEEARALARLAPVLERRLREEQLERVFTTLELPLVPVLEAMERHGIRLDPDALVELSQRLGASLAELEREIHADAGGPFNVNSPQQLAEVLFGRRGLPVLRRTAKTRVPSTDADVLTELAARGHRLPALLLEYREQAKLKSTYVDALPKQVGPDGRIHTRFNQAVAATGRLSSSDPNLQNIPARTEIGREVRRAFVAEPGQLLIAVDYSQIELRILAHLSGDPGVGGRVRPRRGHPPRDRRPRLRRGPRARDPGAAARREDDQLRPHLRHGRLRPGARARGGERRGAALHRRLLRAPAAGARLPRRHQGAGPEHRQGEHHVRARPLDRGSRLEERPDQGERGTPGDQRAGAGDRGGPDEALDDPGARGAPRARGGGPPPPAGARRAHPRGGRELGAKRRGARSRGDGGRRDARGAAQSGRRNRAFVGRGKRVR